MIDVSRVDLINALEVARKSICGYYSNGKKDSRCDCKFGAVLAASGEKNGCPELRTVIAALKRMSDIEYKTFISKN